MFDALESIIDFFIMIVEGIWNFLDLLINAPSNVYNVLLSMPDFISAGAITICSVSIIYVVGRLL